MKKNVLFLMVLAVALSFIGCVERKTISLEEVAEVENIVYLDMEPSENLPWEIFDSVQKKYSVDDLAKYCSMDQINWLNQNPQPVINGIIDTKKALTIKGTERNEKTKEFYTKHALIIYNGKRYLLLTDVKMACNKTAQWNTIYPKIRKELNDKMEGNGLLSKEEWGKIATQLSNLMGEKVFKYFSRSLLMNDNNVPVVVDLNTRLLFANNGHVELTRQRRK